MLLFMTEILTTADSPGTLPSTAPETFRLIKPNRRLRGPASLTPVDHLDIAATRLASEHGQPPETSWSDVCRAAQQLRLAALSIAEVTGLANFEQVTAPVIC
jgi:hypothetical protein